MPIKLITPIDTADASNARAFTLGTRTETKEGNEYIYLPGVASCAQYDWVGIGTGGTNLSYGSVTRLLTTTGTEVSVAVAQAAITAAKYGWFQIKGVGWGNNDIAITSLGTSKLYASGTAGLATTTTSSGARIGGVTPVGAGGAGGTMKVFLNYPHMVRTIDINY